MPPASVVVRAGAELAGAVNRAALGKAGEAGAAAFLAARGYVVVDANVRPLAGMARGEIDIVAWDGEMLAFVEVKARRVAFGSQGTPREAVNASKRRQLLLLAEAYLARQGLDGVPCRFDVVEVVQSEGRLPVFTLLRNAFDAGDCA